ncbi:hypothetical protein ACIRN4_06355 [Pimelobacter simplex]|uniref:hypothetical protein n=1 Tax=Nocardioides simplex TaxID=2045 RepID=UPI00382BCE8F
MTKTTVRWNSDAAQSMLDGGSGVRDLLRDKAERVLAAAKADPHDDTYDYENSLHIVEDHTDRLVMRVVAGDKKSPILESKYGILAKALDAAGGD